MRKYIKYIQVAFVAFALVACSEDYLDVNTDPNNPTSVSPDLILSAAQVQTARYMYLDRYTNTLGNMFMVNWSQADGYSWYYDEFNYLVTSSFYSQVWNNTYLGPLKDYEVLTDLEGDTYDNYKAIAKIMKSFHFQMLVDAYGDIPYSEALQRADIPTPKYDDAQAIYEDLIVQIDEAIALIKGVDIEDLALAPGADDVVFGGDMTSWIQFANTLKLRILIRQSEMSGRDGYIQQHIDDIVAEGSGFITGDAVINPGYVNEEGKQNPFYQSYGLTVSGDVQNNFSATSASEYIIDYLQATSDPRIDRIYEEPATGHLGVPQGIVNYPTNQMYNPENVSNLGPGLLKGSDQDAPLMLFSESLFLQAEAVQRGYLSGDAQSLYEAGIAASFDYLGVEASPSTYYSQSLENVSWSASTNKIEAIITQKWIALNGVNGFESWVEYNRTGYPTGLPVPLNNSHSDRPMRLAYPSSEETGNIANMPSQPDVFSTPIFWAAN